MSKFKSGDRVVYVREGSEYFGHKSVVLKVENKVHLYWDKIESLPDDKWYRYSGELEVDLEHEDVFNSPLYKALA